MCRKKFLCYYYCAHLSVLPFTNVNWAVVARTKEAFSFVWVETTSGRAGNDLASALSHLLNNILPKYPAIEYMWSDSCVAQNRNQLLSYVQQLYLQSNTRINSITPRYCEPGHSNIQDAYTLLSNIERSRNKALQPLFWFYLFFFCWLSPSHTTTKKGNNYSLKNLKLQNWLILSGR